MFTKILNLIILNLKWIVLIFGIFGLIVFIKFPDRNLVILIFSLIAIVLAIFYLKSFEKFTIEDFQHKIKCHSLKNKFVLLTLGIITILFSCVLSLYIYEYLSTFHYYQEKISLDDALVLCLDFEEGEGDIVYDKNPIGNNGKNYGDPKWVEGKKGMALEFNAENDYVDLGKWREPFISQDYTIILWVYIKEFPKDNAFNYIFWRRDDAPSLEFNKDGTLLNFYTDGNYGQFIPILTEPNNYINKWNHIAVSYNGIIGKIYVNGNLKKEKNLTGIHYTNPQNLYLAWDKTKGRNLKGRLDEIKIYDKALDNAEIKRLYLGGGKSVLFSSFFRVVFIISLIILIIIISFLEYLIRKRRNEQD